MLEKMFKLMKKGNNKGFTLAELMVVIVIIGVLTAIAVPIYNNATAKAKLNAIAANLRIIDGAIGQYQANNEGSYPTSSDELSGYIQKWPTSPKEATYGLASTGGVYYAVVTLSAKVDPMDPGTYTLEQVLDVINGTGSGGSGGAGS